jgi:putative sigma-54 modulation protein
MNIKYVARHFEMNAELRDYTEGKMHKVEKFVDEPFDVQVILVQEKHRYMAEIKVNHRHGVIQATEETTSIEGAINLAVDKIEKQARRARKKFMDTRRRMDRATELPHWPVEVLEPSSLTGGSDRKVIKTSTLPIKPMTVEEAALKLEDSSNDFVVFKDSTNHQVSVLYKRRDANFGLISAEA